MTMLYTLDYMQYNRVVRSVWMSSAVFSLSSYFKTPFNSCQWFNELAWHINITYDQQWELLPISWRGKHVWTVRDLTSKSSDWSSAHPLTVQEKSSLGLSYAWLTSMSPRLILLHTYSCSLQKLDMNIQGICKISSRQICLCGWLAQTVLGTLDSLFTYNRRPNNRTTLETLTAQPRHFLGSAIYPNRDVCPLASTNSNQKQTCWQVHLTSLVMAVSHETIQLLKPRKGVPGSLYLRCSLM